MNEENDWVKDLTSEKKEGSACRISESEVRAALKNMKMGKAGGSSGVVTEMFTAAGEVSVEWLVELCNSILSEGHTPEEWKSSICIPIYKGKGDLLDCGAYRGVKLLELN